MTVVKGDADLWLGWSSFLIVFHFPLNAEPRPVAWQSLWRMLCNRDRSGSAGAADGLRAVQAPPTFSGPRVLHMQRST